MKKILLLVFLGIFISGCGTSKAYHLIKPIEPKTAGWVGNPYWPQKVSNLQPKFRWESKSNCTYDFIIYEAVMVEGMESGWDKVASPGEEVFYKEGIEKPEFILPIALKSGTDYVWSVRTRSSEGVSEWATYDVKSKDFFNISAGGTRIYRNVYFWIKTP